MQLTVLMMLARKCLSVSGDQVRGVDSARKPCCRNGHIGTTY